MLGRLALACGVAVLLWAPADARALPGLGVQAEAGTLFPLQVDGRLRFRIPGGIYFGGGVGWMPGQYVDVINDFATAYDAYDADTADLIRDSLEDSLVLDATLGWDPGRFGGFRFGAHYTYETLGGNVSSRSLFESTTGLTVPAQIPDVRIPLESRLHLLGVSVGLIWEIGLVHVAAEVAVRFPLAARSSIVTDEQGPEVDELQRQVDDFFDDALLGIVIPSAGLYVGVNL